MDEIYRALDNNPEVDLLTRVMDTVSLRLIDGGAYRVDPAGGGYTIQEIGPEAEPGVDHYSTPTEVIAQFAPFN